MPTGNAGAAFMENLPSGQFVEHDVLFDNLTERNVVALDPVNLPGLSTNVITTKVPNNGLLANIRIILKGTLTVTPGTGSCTSGYQWPWNVIKTFTMNVNGQTQLKNAEGLDFRMRRQRVNRHPREELSSAVNTDTVGAVVQTAATGNPRPGTIAGGSYAVILEWLMPMVHDDTNLIGLLYAQSDQNYLSFKIQPAATSDLFVLTGTATATLTGTFYISTEYFDIPLAPSGLEGAKAGAVVIPNMEWLHGILTSDKPFSNTGTVSAPFIRADGSLLLYAAYLDNGGITQIAVTTLTRIGFKYGGNRTPRNYAPVEQLLAKNITDYNGRLQPEWIIIDNETDNPVRDAVFPKGVSELKIDVDIPQATTINANARIHFLEETLFSGA